MASPLAPHRTNWWPKQTSAVPGAFGITRQSFEEIDTLINSLRRGSSEWVYAMDVAAELLANTSKGLVQNYYRGPVDPQYRFAASGTIPIPRRTSRSYQGWVVRRVGMGVWELFNVEAGAYMVEYGARGMPPRKPLQKSAVATLRFIQRTRFANRIAQETFGSLRNNKGQFRTFSSRIKGSNLMGVYGPTMAGPSGNLP